MMESHRLELNIEARSDTSHESSSSPFPERLRQAVADLVLKTTAECIWLIDAQARTTFVNRRMADLLCYTEEEMIGRPIFEFLDRARWQLAEQNLRKRKLGFEDRQEVELIRKDGSRIWILGSANPVFDRNGNYAGAMALLGDLTAQKEREGALRAQLASIQAESESRGVAPASASPSGAASSVVAREPFRTALALGILGALVATITVTTVGAVIASISGADSRSNPDVSY